MTCEVSSEAESDAHEEGSASTSGRNDDTTSGIRLLINDADGPVVLPWHGPRGRWAADLVRMSGELVARDTSSLYFLRLCYGSRTIDLDEAQDLIT